jgi:hypothetical protein
VQQYDATSHFPPHSIRIHFVSDPTNTLTPSQYFNDATMSGKQAGFSQSKVTESKAQVHS